MNTASNAHQIISSVLNDSLGKYIIDGYIATTPGLKKTINEDLIGYNFLNSKLTCCLCDGHWGDKAAEMVFEAFLQSENSFPNNRNESVSFLKEIEKAIFEKLGNPFLTGLDGNETPETSFLAFEIRNDELHLITYGDCRFFLLNDKTIFSAPLIRSWLGSFSYLGLRERLKLEDSLFYSKLPISQGDSILFFSDGIDECIYEKSTILISEICKIGQSNLSPKQAITTLLQKVFEYGAEDNASIGLLRIL